MTRPALRAYLHKEREQERRKMDPKLEKSAYPMSSKGCESMQSTRDLERDATLHKTQLTQLFLGQHAQSVAAFTLTQLNQVCVQIV